MSLINKRVADRKNGEEVKKNFKKNKSKKFLTNEKFCGKINELIRVGTAKILDN